ncbi:hypothetical protein JW921_07835 [Candidatus Fermentibacterales bacterium]|nr:hypothetical protein [Candidatus Fermentibacterales bacterium]
MLSPILPLLLVSSLAQVRIAVTPEEFLAQLADSSSGAHGARFWVNRFSPRSDQPAPGFDEMIELLADRRDLSVSPGRAALVEADSISPYYRVAFESSEWTWVDAEGRLSRSRGCTIVDFIDGRFYWVSIPMVPIEFSKANQAQVAFVLTVMVIGGAFVVILFFRRMLLR